MAEKNLSISSSDGWSFILGRWNGSVARGGVLCLLLAAFLYFCMDAMGVLIWISVYVGLVTVCLRLSGPARPYVMIFLVSLLMFCVGGEGYFRLSEFGLPGLSLKKYTPADYGNPFSNLQYSPDTYTGLAPGSVAWFKAAPMRVNNRGFRGKDFSEAKADDTFRLAVVGASATMGAGVENADLFTQKLEDRFAAADFSGRIEVLNFGVSGSTFGNMLHLIQQEVSRYHPDIILFHTHWNLAGPDELEIKARKAKAYTGSTWLLYLDEKYEFFRNHSFFARLLRMSRKGKLFHQQLSAYPLHKLRAHLGFHHPPGQTQTETSDAKWARQLPSFSETMQILHLAAGDAHVVLYTLRPMDPVVDHALSASFSRFVRHTTEAYGMTFIDGYTAALTAMEARDMILYPGDRHPNKRGHEFHADYLYAGLTPVVRALQGAALHSEKDGRREQ